MFNSSTSSVKLLAAVIWYGGGFILLWKAGELLQNAWMLRPGNISPWAALIIGVLIGIFKARYLFARVGENNLNRIDAIRRPKIWQCYRRRFFIFLIFMIVLGFLLSIWSHGRYVMLLGVAVLDLSIGVALLASSYVYWKKGNS